MSIAFIVDGQQEKGILQRLCSDPKIHMTHLNGKDVAIQAIAKHVASHIRLLKDRYYPIYVIIDREGRKESSCEIEKILKEELKRLGTNVDCVKCSVPDRMIENWILAGNPICEDGKVLRSETSKDMESENGKVVLKSLMRSKGLTYSETGNGIDMFCHMDMKGARLLSKSFSRFYAEIFSFCPKLRYLEQN